MRGETVIPSSTAQVRWAGVCVTSKVGMDDKANEKEFDLEWKYRISQAQPLPLLLLFPLPVKSFRQKSNGGPVSQFLTWKKKNHHMHILWGASSHLKSSFLQHAYRLLPVLSVDKAEQPEDGGKGGFGGNPTIQATPCETWQEKPGRLYAHVSSAKIISGTSYDLFNTAFLPPLVGPKVTTTSSKGWSSTRWPMTAAKPCGQGGRKIQKPESLFT